MGVNETSRSRHFVTTLTGPENSRPEIVFVVPSGTYVFFSTSYPTDTSVMCPSRTLANASSPLADLPNTSVAVMLSSFTVIALALPSWSFTE